MKIGNPSWELKRFPAESHTGKTVDIRGVNEIPNEKPNFLQRSPLWPSGNWCLLQVGLLFDLIYPRIRDITKIVHLCVVTESIKFLNSFIIWT